MCRILNSRKDGPAGCWSDGQGQKRGFRKKWRIPDGCFVCFETWPHLAQADLKHTMLLKMELNFSPLPSARVTGMFHHSQISHGKVLHITSRGFAQAGSCPRDSIRRLSDNHILCAHRNLLRRQHYQQRNGGFHHVLRGCHIPFQMLTASGLVPSCRIFPGMGTHDLGFSLRSTRLHQDQGNSDALPFSPGQSFNLVLLYSRGLSGSISLA